MSTVTLQCEYCEEFFERRIYDHNYNTKKGRRIFCSKKCSNAATKDERTERIQENCSGYESLRKYWEGHEPDKDHRAFTFIVQKARNRRKDLEVTITIEDVKELWINQKGICPYTGIQLQLPDYSKVNHKLYSASLDRIDSKKGYIKGNVQFVSVMINLAKSTMSHDETVEFCKAIAKQWKDQ